MKYLNHCICRSGLYPQVVACLLGLFWLATCAQAADRLDLEGTAGDLAARPMNSLVDEILAPIDRDVFLRELEYYEAVHSSK
jgi:hypothetical protein